MNNKTILIVVAAVVVLGAIFFFAFGNNADDVALNVPGTVTNTASTSQEVAAYNAQQAAQNQDDQNPDTQTAATNRVVLAETLTGNFATVAQANLTKPGYVVIYRVNSNGDSSVLGHSDLLTAGAHTNISIQLDTPVAVRQAVVSVLHEDDGDSKFEYPESDGYLVNAGSMLASDIDVVDVTSAAEESKVLEAQVKAFLENNFKTGTSSN
jgi:flagellar basal body-associated protein FliL